jgi:hypothetical protein
MNEIIELDYNYILLTTKLLWNIYFENEIINIVFSKFFKLKHYFDMVH